MVKGRVIVRLFAAIAMIASLSPLAFAGDDITIKRVPPPAQITQFTLDVTPPKIHNEQVGNQIQEYIYLEGSFDRPNWNILIGALKLKRNKLGKFKVKTRLTAKRKLITLAAVGPGGQIQTEVVEVLYPGYVPKNAKPHRFAVGAGLSFLNYTQTGSSVTGVESVTFHETAITVKGTYTQRFGKSPWDVGFTGFMTALPLSADIGGTTARFLGLNLRFGYTFPSVTDPWKITLAGGLYYTTMFVSTSTLPTTFGFQNLMGPQLFPVVRYQLHNGNSISTYFKYSPVSSGGGFSMDNLSSSREIAFGLTFSQRLRNGHYIPISFDYSDLHTVIEDTPVVVNSINFSLGYTF
jgi:hypothetical protein